MSDPELVRVREAYSRRTGKVGLYDARRADQIAAQAGRAAAWGAALLRYEHDLGVTVEVGAGTGAILQWALALGAAPAIGVDVLRERVEAVKRAPVHAIGVVSDGRSLPLASGVVDSVLCAALFSSLLEDDVAAAIGAEIDRVLRPGGMVLFYDFMRNNPRNPDVRGVREEALQSWFPGFRVELQRVTLAPPIARRLLRYPNLARVAEVLRPLRTHLAGALVKP